MRRVTWSPLLLLVMVSAILSACGGKGLPGSSDDTAASPPAAAVDSTATTTAAAAKLVPLLANVTPVLPAATPGAGSVLGGADRRTAATLTALLKGTALDQAGVAIYVFPIAGAGGSLLVLEMDAAKGASFSGDPLPIFKALVASDAARSANLKQVAINYRATDAQGPYIITMTFAMSVAEGYAKGTLSQKDALNQVPFEIKRGQP